MCNESYFYHSIPNITLTVSLYQDMVEWAEDPDEYLRKNLPTELVCKETFFVVQPSNFANNYILILLSIVLQEEISGWREDLFTARKSALNLLGVIVISKVHIPICNFTCFFNRESDC